MDIVVFVIRNTVAVVVVVVIVTALWVLSYESVIRNTVVVVAILRTQWISLHLL